MSEAKRETSLAVVAAAASWGAASSAEAAGPPFVLAASEGGGGLVFATCEAAAPGAAWGCGALMASASADRRPRASPRTVDGIGSICSNAAQGLA